MSNFVIVRITKVLPTNGKLKQPILLFPLTSLQVYQYFQKSFKSQISSTFYVTFHDHKVLQQKVYITLKTLKKACTRQMFSFI